MAFLRFSRDKRGYEHFYLVEPTTNRRGRVRARVLYWFRTPPSVKVGREPFDPEVRRALEAQNPRVAFDWRKIVETPIPSADVERWRERRRSSRGGRPIVPGATATTADTPVAPLPEPSLEADVLAPLSAGEAGAEPEASLESDQIEAVAVDAAERQEDSLDTIEPKEPTVEIASVAPLGQQTPSGPGTTRKRRRRRRRRGRRGRPFTGQMPAGSPAGEPAGTSRVPGVPNEEEPGEDV